MKTRFKTDQAIFNFVKTRLLKQGKRSTYNGVCQYRGSQGLRCAVGWLITDDNYSSYLEGAIVGNPRVNTALEASGVFMNPSTRALLDRLQTIHDKRKPCTWPAAFRTLHFNAYGMYTGKRWRP